MEYQLAEQRRQFAREFGQIVLQSPATLLGLAFSGATDQPANTGGTSCSGYSSPAAGRKQGKCTAKKKNNPFLFNHSLILLSFWSHYFYNFFRALWDLISEQIKILLLFIYHLTQFSLIYFAALANSQQIQNASGKLLTSPLASRLSLRQQALKFSLFVNRYSRDCVNRVCMCHILSLHVYVLVIYSYLFMNSESNN